MYAQEARTYTLVAALLVAGVYAHARLMAGGSRRGWWLLIGASALGMWTRYSTGLLLATFVIQRVTEPF